MVKCVYGEVCVSVVKCVCGEVLCGEVLCGEVCLGGEVCVW